MRRPRALPVQPPPTASPPMPAARARRADFFFITPAPSATAQGQKGREGIDTSAGLGGAWPTEPYFPKQISEGCHPTEACTRPTVSSLSASVCAILLSNSLSTRSLFQWGLLVYTVRLLILLNCMVGPVLTVKCHCVAKQDRHAPICVVCSLSRRQVLLAVEVLCLWRQISPCIVHEVVIISHCLIL